MSEIRFNQTVALRKKIYFSGHGYTLKLRSQKTKLPPQKYKRKGILTDKHG